MGKLKFLIVIILCSSWGIAAKAQQFKSHMTVDKVNDSTLLFYGKVICVGPGVLDVIADDSIYFYDMVSGNIIPKKCSVIQTTGIATSYVECYYTLNLNDSFFSSFVNKDSFLAIFNTKSWSGLPIYNTTYSSRNYSSRANYRGNLYLVTKVYLSNLKKIDYSSGPRFKHLESELGYRSDALYESPFITEKDLDILEFANSKPYCMEYYTFPFIWSGYRYPGQYLSGYNEHKPTNLYCPYGPTNCQPKPDLYPPHGLTIKPKTGDYIIGLDKGGPAGCVLTRRIIESRNVNGDTLKLSETYLTSLIINDVWYTSPVGYNYNFASRISAAAYEYHICADDTFELKIESTPAGIFNCPNFQTYMLWDTGIVNASFNLSTGKKEQSGLFKWSPNLNDINSEPHRFSVLVRTQDTFTCLGSLVQVSPHLNSRTILIYVHSPITSKLVVDSVSCGQVSCHAQDTIAVPINFTYTWQLLSLNRQDTLDTKLGKTVKLNAPDSGTFVVRMYVAGAEGQCPYEAFDTLTIDTFLQMSLTDQQFCDYGSGLLTPELNYTQTPLTYEWTSKIDTINTPTYTYATTRTDSVIRLQVSDSKGCTVADSAKVKINQLPVFAFPADTTLCFYDSVKLLAPTQNYKLLWYDGDTIASQKIARVNNTYWLQVTDSNSCTYADTLKVYEQVHPNLGIIALSKLCTNDSVHLSIAEAPRWKNEKWQIEQTSYVTPIVHLKTNKLQLPYTLITTFDSLGLQCAYTKSDSVQLFAPPQFSLEYADTICSTDLPFKMGYTANQSVSITADANLDAIQPAITWQNGTTYYGLFEVRAKAENKNECISYDTARFFVGLQDSIYLNAVTEKCIETGTQIAIAYGSKYNLPQTLRVNNQVFTGNMYTLTVSDSAKGLLNLALRAERIVGCLLNELQADVNLKPNPSASFTANPEKGCEKLKVQLTADEKNLGTYSWFVNGIKHAETSDEWMAEWNNGTYNIQLQTENNGCSDTSATKTIEVYPRTAIKISYQPATAFISTPKIEFRLEQNIGLSNYVWTKDGQEISTSSRAEIVPSDTGDFLVKLQATNTFGCESADSVWVHIYPEAFIVLPTAFTPNGDGLNDSYKPVMFGIDNYRMHIYNQWGEKVYDAKNGSWDGKNALLGAYLCLVEYTKPNGETGKLKSTIYVLN